MTHVPEIKLSHRQLNVKNRALTWYPSTLNPNLPIHRLYQAVRDIETEARTAYRTINIAFQAHKTLEEASLVLWQDTLTLICNTYHHRAVMLHHTGGEDKRCEWRRIFQCIHTDIHQYLA